MRFTVSRRITLALALELVLVAMVALLGSRALATTSHSYEEALAARRDLVAPAFRAESELRGANIEQLRYMVDNGQRSLRSRDSSIALAKKMIVLLQEKSPTPELRARWTDTILLLGKWVASLDARIGADCGSHGRMHRSGTGCGPAVDSAKNGHFTARQRGP